MLSYKISEKLTNYARETTSMPFLAKLMQDSEKVASYSFIHSLATILGQSVYEKVHKYLRENLFNGIVLVGGIEI